MLDGHFKTVTESAQFLVLSEPPFQKLNKNIDKLHHLLLLLLSLLIMHFYEQYQETNLYAKVERPMTSYKNKLMFKT